jgi:hypothetical protein
VAGAIGLLRPFGNAPSLALTSLAYSHGSTAVCVDYAGATIALERRYEISVVLSLIVCANRTATARKMIAVRVCLTHPSMRKKELRFIENLAAGRFEFSVILKFDVG